MFRLRFVCQNYTPNVLCQALLELLTNEFTKAISIQLEVKHCKSLPYFAIYQIALKGVKGYFIALNFFKFNDKSCSLC